MGPLATADLYKKIVLLTKASCDNEHIRVYIDSNARIPDRTAAILSGGKDPLPEMTSALRNLEKCGADCILMPCNTAHYFLPQLQKLTDIPFISLIETTAKACAEKFPGKKAAVLATSGTLKTGVYSDVLDKYGISYIIPDEEEQKILMYLIYDVVKASKSVPPEREKWEKLLAGLKKKGADYFILGCTELPIVASFIKTGYAFVDPTTEMAEAAIRFCGHEIADTEIVP